MMRLGSRWIIWFYVKSYLSDAKPKDNYYLWKQWGLLIWMRMRTTRAHIYGEIRWARGKYGAKFLLRNFLYVSHFEHVLDQLILSFQYNTTSCHFPTSNYFLFYNFNENDKNLHSFIVRHNLINHWLLFGCNCCYQIVQHLFLEMIPIVACNLLICLPKVNLANWKNTLI